jgi:hypothetical protein
LSEGALPGRWSCKLHAEAIRANEIALAAELREEAKLPPNDTPEKRGGGPT